MENLRCATCNTEIRPQSFYNRSTRPPVEGTQFVCTACLEKARSITIPVVYPPAPSPGSVVTP